MVYPKSRTSVYAVVFQHCLMVATDLQREHMSATRSWHTLAPLCIMLQRRGRSPCGLAAHLLHVLRAQPVDVTRRLAQLRPLATLVALQLRRGGGFDTSR